MSLTDRLMRIAAPEMRESIEAVNTLLQRIEQSMTASAEHQARNAANTLAVSQHLASVSGRLDALVTHQAQLQQRISMLEARILAALAAIPQPKGELHARPDNGDARQPGVEEPPA